MLYTSFYVFVGYILTDLGYDVWMGNARGNYYSRSHTKYSNSDSVYWWFRYVTMHVSRL